MRIEFDYEMKCVLVNKVAISFELLEAMTNPNARRVLNFQRVGDGVIVQSVALDGPWIEAIRSLDQFDAIPGASLPGVIGKLLRE